MLNKSSKGEHSLKKKKTEINCMSSEIIINGLPRSRRNRCGLKLKDSEKPEVKKVNSKPPYSLE